MENAVSFPDRESAGATLNEIFADMLFCPSIVAVKFSMLPGQ